MNTSNRILVKKETPRRIDLRKSSKSSLIQETNNKKPNQIELLLNVIYDDHWEYIEATNLLEDEKKSRRSSDSAEKETARRVDLLNCQALYPSEETLSDFGMVMTSAFLQKVGQTKSALKDIGQIRKAIFDVVRAFKGRKVTRMRICLFHGALAI